MENFNRISPEQILQKDLRPVFGYKSSPILDFTAED